MADSMAVFLYEGSYKQKKPAPNVRKRACLQENPVATPLPGAWRTGSGAHNAQALCEDAKSSSCSRFTLHFGPFRTQGSPQDHGSADDGRSAQKGPRERDPHGPRLERCPQCMPKQHWSRTRITDDRWGANGEIAHHDEMSTPVANRSAHALRHDLRNAMDSRWSQVDASETREVSALCTDRVNVQSA
ncbi:hypothetical protein D9M68_460780 [compost metagenome]